MGKETSLKFVLLSDAKQLLQDLGTAEGGYNKLQSAINNVNNQSEKIAALESSVAQKREDAFNKRLEQLTSEGVALDKAEAKANEYADKEVARINAKIDNENKRLERYLVGLQTQIDAEQRRQDLAAEAEKREEERAQKAAEAKIAAEEKAKIKLAQQLEDEYNSFQKQINKELDALDRIQNRKAKEAEKARQIKEEEVADAEKAAAKKAAIAEEEFQKQAELIRKIRQQYLDGFDAIEKGFAGVFTSLTQGKSPLDDFEKAFSGIQNLVGDTTKSLGTDLGGKFSGLITAGKAVVETFAEITHSALEAQKQLDILTNTTGVSATNITALKLGADQIGASFIQLVSGIDKFAERYRGALEGIARDKKTFDDLGVSLTDAEGKQRSLNDVLEESIKKFGALPGGTEKAAIGYEFFGVRAGKVFAQVSGQLDDLKKKSEEAGLVLSNIDAQKLRNLTSDLTDV